MPNLNLAGIAIETKDEFSRQYASGAKSAGIKQALHYATKDELFDELRLLLRQGDVVWPRASGSMKLEDII